MYTFLTLSKKLSSCGLLASKERMSTGMERCVKEKSRSSFTEWRGWGAMVISKIHKA